MFWHLKGKSANARLRERMGAEISERKKKILQIVVDEYIETATPVSSKAITQKHLTEVSSATVHRPKPKISKNSSSR